MMGGFGMGAMGFGWILWIVVLGVAVFAIVRSTSSSQNTSKPTMSEPPLDILRRRYARGEINAEEYRQIQEDLKR